MSVDEPVSVVSHDFSPGPLRALRGMDILVLSPTPTYPVDHGNRKRIHAYCSRLKREGARIHFVYYAFEWWHGYIPHEAMREMTAQWDSFHLIPITRSIQTPAKGEDHLIDEWWDESIGTYLKWLFERARYDVFIVNYCFFSKALEYAPRETFKILDTHDRFTGRRQLLEANGVAREFFHTTREQEAIALDRADLVWAIKDHEADFFRTITKNSIATLPYVEPRLSIARKRAEADKDYLVLGLVGARNSVNHTNAKQVIDAMLPLFRRHLAPIKIKIGGGMCADFETWESLPAGLELFGPFERAEEFYEAIDVVLLPLTFSTGLKIKAVEALATGLPFVAHEHCVEGLPVTHRYHCCTSLDDMARKCLNLACDPVLLEELRSATPVVYGDLETQVERGFQDTALQIRKNWIVLAVAPEFFDPNSPYRIQVLQHLYYFKNFGSVALYFDKPLPRQHGARMRAIQHLAHEAKLVLSRAAAAGMGIHNERDLTYASMGMSTTLASLPEFCAAQASATVVLLDLPERFADEAVGVPNMVVYARFDTIALIGHRPRHEIAAELNRIPFLTLMSSCEEWLDTVTELPLNATFLQVPFWKDITWSELNREPLRNRVGIACSEKSLPLAKALFEHCAERFAQWEGIDVYVACANARLEELKLKYAGAFQHALVTASEPLLNHARFLTLPYLLIDVSFHNPDVAPLRETVARRGAVVIELGGSGPLALNNDDSIQPGSCRSVSSLWGMLNSLDGIATHADSLGSSDTSENLKYANDAGWTHVWHRMKAQTALVLGSS